jgi:GntR family transcriptional regulator / MocR family aminotransferase
MNPSRKLDRSWAGAKWLLEGATIERMLGNLHIQTMQILNDGIRRQEIPEGARMPSSRTIAELLGISRNTAKLAIEGLVEQGVLRSRDRSGTYVATLHQTPSVRVKQSPAPDSMNWERRFAHRSMPDFAATVNSAQKTSFVYGQFDPSVFPTGRWRECERAALSVAEIQAWGKDVVDEDAPLLVAQLRDQVLPRHGILARAENILITLGGQEGRYLATRLLGGAGTTTGIEHPGMPDMAKILLLSPTKLRPLELDQDGVILGEQLRGCDTIFVTCGHQCPTTAVMPLERRRSLLSQAMRDDFIVVEDTFETELFAEPEHLPALKSMEGADRVIHVASLSKLIAPGLRIGYVVADAAVIERMRALRRLIHRHPPGNNQRALAIFIQRGHYRTFLRRAKEVMREREAIMAEALNRRVPYLEWSHCPGASTFWVKMPKGIDCETLAKQAALNGVLVEPGTRYFYARREADYLRLAVSSISASQISEGIRGLAEALANDKNRLAHGSRLKRCRNWNR